MHVLDARQCARVPGGASFPPSSPSLVGGPVRWTPGPAPVVPLLPPQAP